VEVVGWVEAVLVAEELDEEGEELGGGAEEVAEVGLDDGAEALGGEVEPGEPAAGGEADAVSGIEFDGQAVEDGGLDAEEAADFGEGGLGGIEGEGAAEEEALALVVGHEDEGGVVFLIQLETGKDAGGLGTAFEGPAKALEDEGEGIKGGGGGSLHRAILPQGVGHLRGYPREDKD